MRLTIVLVATIAIAAVSHAATLKVPGQYLTIQDAIDAASGGDTVLVAPGTYVENIDFLGKAITVTSEQGAEVTVIDGGKPINPLIGSVVTFNSGEGPDSILEGFTIRNGYGTWYQGGGFYVYQGGGIRCFLSSPTILDNIISKNHADMGGGIACRAGSSPIIANNTITVNQADGGGGIYCSNGLLCRQVSSPIIVNNTITRNIVEDGGGGIGCFFNSNPMIRNNTLSGNVVTNVLGCGGGGIHLAQCSPTISNTILWDNHATQGQEITIDDPSSYFPSVLTISYSDVKGGKSAVYIAPGSTLNWGAGNLDSNPLFVEETNDDFHLTFNSPCRGSGDNSAVTEPYDFEGDPRISYGTVDMGADEFYTHLYWTGHAKPGWGVDVKFVGLPGISPVGLCIGTGVLDPPIPSMWGDWYLKFPIFGPIVIPVPIPSSGVMVLPGVIPGSPPAPHAIPMQALIGAELTNLCVLEIQ